MLVRLAVELDPLLRFGKQVENLVPLKLRDAGQAGVRKGVSARRKAAGA